MDDKINISGMAARYLGRSMKTVQQLRTYLSEREYEADAIEDVIQEFKKDGYLDDVAYAMAFIRNGFRKGWSINRIKIDLRQRGVSDANFEDGLWEVMQADGYKAGDELTRASRVVKTFVQREEIDIEEVPIKLYNRILRRLKALGYEPSIAYKAMSCLKCEKGKRW